MTDWKQNKTVDDSGCATKPTAKGWQGKRRSGKTKTDLSHAEVATIAIMQIKLQIADLKRLERWIESDKNGTEFPTASEFVQNIAQNLGGIWGTVSEWEKTKRV